MHYVIIGAGPAGVIAAETLRKLDAGAAITIIGDEPEPPYSRMALPYFLAGDIAEQGTYLRKTAHHFQLQRIQIRQGRVEQIATREHRVYLQGGESLAYDKLLIASGSRPLKPAVQGIELPGIFPCWTLADARKIAGRCFPGNRVVLMGAGFIGCILLEALVKSGAEVTIVEIGERMVPRMMNAKAGHLIKQWCLHKGVNVLTGTRVNTINSSGAGELLLTLDNEVMLEAEMIVSATGVEANIGFLQGSGIHTGQGILVNRHMRTNIEDVYAAGDVAQGLDFSTGDYKVQAIQPTAADHAQLAARNMAGLSQAVHQGAINMNVLDTLGLISCSFGLWQGISGGESTELYQPQRFQYLNLQLLHDTVIGATSLGQTQHIGVLRGLIQGKVKLGRWKDILLKDPSRIMEAYLANRLPLQQ